MSRPGYVDRRGSSRTRKRRREWLLQTFDPDLGPDRAACRLRLSAECVAIVDEITLSVDRIEPGGLYSRDNIQPACKPCQDKQGGLAAAQMNAQMIDDYRAARDAREALRESGVLAPSRVAGIAHSDVAMYQLDDADFDAAVPSVTFREWLIEWGKQRREA